MKDNTKTIQDLKQIAANLNKVAGELEKAAIEPYEAVAILAISNNWFNTLLETFKEESKQFRSLETAFKGRDNEYIYLEYVNDFLTVAGMAEYYNVNREELNELLSKTKIEREERIRKEREANKSKI